MDLETVFLALFPLAMIGGVIVQIAAPRLGYAALIDRGLMNRISGTALDLLIVAALGALSLDAIGANAGPFLVLAAGGILWNLFGAGPVLAGVSVIMAGWLATGWWLFARRQGG